MGSYDAFLRAKSAVATRAGFDVEDSEIHHALFGFQRAIVGWAIRRGRAAIFADCGMGKTLMQIEWARHVCTRTGGNVLILCPLAVSVQTQAEAERFGYIATICRSGEDVRPGINIANYERLSGFDPSQFAGIVLDESSILKSFDGATRKAIQSFADPIAYRLACTATPAPNDHTEIGTHAEFLAVCSRSEMLATYFCHDGGETQKWRLKGHAVGAFWSWVASWAVAVRKPSDLGFCDDGYDLPGLTIHDHPVDDETFDKGRTLFGVEASGLTDQREARRSSLMERVARCAEIVNAEPDQSWIVWCDLNDEGADLVKAIPFAVQVTGSDKPEAKEAAMLAFSRGDVRVLISKPSICGFGMNWQHCARVAFVGVTHSYETFYQAVRRCWRFGQQRPVHCHVVYASSEGAVVRNLRRKEDDARTLAREMVSAMASSSLVSTDESRSRDGYQQDLATGRGWAIHRGDCVEVLRTIPSESVGYSIFSPPFASLYTYSNSERDMGNCRSDDEFAAHFAFAIAELLRVLKPGRLVSFHCMNLPTSKERDGYIGIRDFRGRLIQMFQDAGFIFHSEVVIWKDPVTAMQRTKALGLLHKTIRTDSAMSRQGIPDYLVTMRKPGQNPEPIAHSADQFPVDLWQRYASPVWMDINPSNTLQAASAREDKDERHICPLQLQVIERAMALWSNPEDVVLSPFAGIGSEGHVAILAGRQFLGIELKESYWRQAAANLSAAETAAGQLNLFGEGK